MSGTHSDSDGSWSLVEGEDDSSASSTDFVKVESAEAVSYHPRDHNQHSDAESDGAESACASLSSWDNGWFWDDTDTSGLSPASGTAPPLTEEMDDTVTNADDEASSIEELNLADLNTHDDYEQDIVVPEAPLSPPAPPEESGVAGRFRKPRLTPSQASTGAQDSESEHSDFTRLEAPSHSEMEEDAGASILLASSPPGVLRISPAASVTHSAPHSASSSISASFRFVNPGSASMSASGSSVGSGVGAGVGVNPVRARQEQEEAVMAAQRRRTTAATPGYRRCFRRSYDELDAYAYDDDDDLDNHNDDNDNNIFGLNVHHHHHHHRRRNHRRTNQNQALAPYNGGGGNDGDGNNDSDNDYDDDDALPSDVDDRCESDISGVVRDDDDDVDDGAWGAGLAGAAGAELWSAAAAGDVRRSYRHHANTTLNAVLSTLAIMALASALGIGIGHFLGMQREMGVRRQQEVKMRDLQDDYLHCLKQRDSYYKQINDPIFPNQKLNAITGVWKQKYEDLILEKVELEQRIQDLEQELEDSVEIAQLQAENHAGEMDRLQEELSGLKVQHTTSSVQAQAELAQLKEQDKQEMEELTERLARQEEENRHLLASLESLESGTSNHTDLASTTTMAQLDAKEEELHTKEVELESKEAELNSKGEELESKGAELGSKEAELGTKEEELVEKESALMSRETELSNREAEMSRMEEEGAETALVHQHSELVEVKKMELAELKKQVADVRSRFEEVSTALMERKAQLASTPSRELSVVEALAFKEELNLLRHENQELRSRLATVLYQMPPAEIATQQPDMKEATETASPSTVITEAIVSIPPTDAASDATDDLDIEMVDAFEEETEEAVGQDEDDAPTMQRSSESNIHEQLASARSRLAAAEEKAERMEHLHRECVANAPPDFLSCMRLLLPTIPANATANVTDFMQRILGDVRFTKAMEQRWGEFREFLERGTDAKLPRKLSKVYGELERTLKAKWDEFVKFAEMGGGGGGGDGEARGTANERLQNVFNKTKETVSQLSEKVHNTWHKVKNLSSEMLREAPVVRDVKEQVQRKVASVGRSVQKGWDAVKEHVNSGLFRKKKPAPEPNKYEGHPQDHLGNSPYADQARMREDTQEEVAKADAKGDTNKGNRQTQSMSLEQKYEEFWKRANYDPDDYVAEDFFQGNQREWKKHQKRFKKLHGRIHRLNEDMLYSMDDDDIEDIYEDLDDFEEDVNLEEQPAKLKNWLTCQIRWWKSRFQRKHRNEDFVKGCDAQLMRWQLRAMCRPLCRGRKCQRRADTNVDACQALFAVLTPKPEPQSESKCENRKDNSDARNDARSVAMSKKDARTDARKEKDPRTDADTKSGTNETIIGDFTMGDHHHHHHHTLTPTPTPTPTPSPNPHDPPSTNFILLEPRDHGDHSPDWVWERYHSREYQREQKPGWQFKRASSRAFEREKPWYYKRSDSRGKHWAEKQGKY